jgi:hypothetical protein
VDAFDILAHGSVDGLAMANVSDVNHDLDEVIHPPAALLEQLPDVLHHFVSLLDWIVTLDVFRGVEILRALAPQVNRSPALRDNGMAQVVIQILLGIGLLCIEFPNSGVRHLPLASINALDDGNCIVSEKKFSRWPLRLVIRPHVRASGTQDTCVAW